MSISTPAELYDACRKVLRLRHLSYRTVQTYFGVIRRLVAFHGTCRSAQPHLEKIGAKPTALSPKQADYIGVSVDGPYKPDSYRY